MTNPMITPMNADTNNVMLLVLMDDLSSIEAFMFLNNPIYILFSFINILKLVKILVLFHYLQYICKNNYEWRYSKKNTSKILKGQKIYANTSIFFYGERCRRNNDALNKFAKLADTSTTSHELERNLDMMLGHTASYCEIVKKPKDHLYKAYKLWSSYIKLHMVEINEIYKNEQSK